MIWRPLAALLLVRAACAQPAPAPGPLWTLPAAERMETGKAGPHVRLADDAVLTVYGDHAYLTHDDGATWSAPVPVIPAGGRFRVSRERALLRTRQGVILLAFLNLADLKWGWNDRTGRPVEGIRADLWVVRSLDEGRTWQAPQLVQRGYCGAVRQMIETTGGRLVMVAQDFAIERARSITLTYASADQGVTWTASNQIDLGGRGHHDGAVEATVAERRDGSLWMLIRTNRDYFWEAISTDHGRSWSTIRPTTIPASSSPGYLARLASGRLLLAWNLLYREGRTTTVRRSGQFSEAPASWNREELAVALSEDDGATWSTPLIVARQENTWLAYPWIFERRPGELWLTTMQGELRLRLREPDLAGPPVRVIAFGDSLTAPRANVVTYSDLLRTELSRGGRRVEVLNRGIPGNTSEMARERFARDVLAARPDLVIIQLGTNDAAVDVWKNPPATTNRVAAGRFRENLLYFLTEIRRIHAGVILMTPNRMAWTPKLLELYGRPPYRPGDPDGFNVLSDLYADVLRGVAVSEGVPLLDPAKVVRAEDLLDGMHPGSPGHARVAALLLPVVIRELAGRPAPAR